MAEQLTLDDAPPSFRAQIDALAVGESFARAQRHNLDTLTDKEAPFEALRKLRLGMQRTVVNVSRDGEKTFTTETGHFLTSSHDLMCVLVITRTG